MYTLALISDVHSNFTALETVLNDINIHYPEVKEIFFIGDLCGYGPDPQECTERILNNILITKRVKGNHDHYIGQGITPPPTNPLAVASINWQLSQLSLEHRLAISKLPQLITTRHLNTPNELCLVHGSPQYPLTEYIYPNSSKKEVLFEYMSNVKLDILVLGHTHIPFILEKVIDSGRKLLIINPGSVGQPRDKDSRASYAVLNIGAMKAKIIRVNYDIDSVVKRMSGLNLPKFLGERLYEGL
ncbi:MAG: metallophosphoesterase family protein [Candidatus Hodarchaeales archaeon]|jgi:putative phosphoesterase